MNRILPVIAISSAVVVAGLAVLRAEPQSESNNQTQPDIATLQKKRIDLLEQRVTAIKKWVDQERVGAAELIRPEMDVINARLDYVDSNAERKTLLAELLVKYDKLIEIAELHVAEPVRPSSDGRTDAMSMESELLFLKSERIRIQILHDTQN